jgi:hypothetical protein
MVVILNDETWAVEKFEKGGIWYSYNNLEAPIIYTIFQRSPERPLVLHQPYTAFKTKNGSSFNDDVELQDYLDEVLAAKEVSDLDSVDINGNSHILTTNVEMVCALKEILIELKTMNDQFEILTGEKI